MIIDWERLNTAGEIVLFGSFTIMLLVIGIVWFYDKCQENDGYKFGFALFMLLLIFNGNSLRDIRSDIEREKIGGHKMIERVALIVLTAFVFALWWHGIDRFIVWWRNK